RAVGVCEFEEAALLLRAQPEGERVDRLQGRSDDEPVAPTAHLGEDGFLAGPKRLGLVGQQVPEPRNGARSAAASSSRRCERAPRRRSSLLLLVVVLVVIVRVLREVDGLLLLVRGAATVVEVVDPLAHDGGFLVLVPFLFLGLDRVFAVACEQALLGVCPELCRRSLAAAG